MYKFTKNEDGTITISEEAYDYFLDRDAKLACLEGFGVDNWQGYDDAMTCYYEENGE